MSKLSKIIRAVIFAAVIVIALLLIVAIFPIKGNYQIKTVLSGSMEPAIHTGSVVIIKPESNYKIGDIVTFGKDTRIEIPTTHRIVSSRAVDGVLLFATKGDANNAPDIKEISQNDIHGKVLFSVPFAGYIVDFVRKPIGLILIIVLPAIFIVCDEVKKIAREIKKMKSGKIEKI